VINLRWDQVDFKDGIITLAETKAGKPQTVMMNAKARQVLKGLDTVARSPWVLPAPAARRHQRRALGSAPVPSLARDLPLSKTTLESAWTKIRIAAHIRTCGCMIFAIRWAPTPANPARTPSWCAISCGIRIWR